MFLKSIEVAGPLGGEAEAKAYVAKEREAIAAWNRVKELHKELAAEAGLAE